MFVTGQSGCCRQPILGSCLDYGNGTPEQRELVGNCIEQGNEQHFDAILAAVTSSGTLDYTRREANIAAKRAADAIAGLPESL